MQGALGVGIEAHAAPAEFGQLLHRAREVGRPHHRDHVRGAGRRLGQCAGERRGVPVLHHHAARAERCGRAQDGADVLGVGHLVQHQDHPLGRPGDVLDVCGLRRHGQEREALVDGALGQEVGDLAVVQGLGPRRPIARKGAARAQDQPAEVLAARIGQGGLDRMAAPQPLHAAFRTRRMAAVKNPGSAVAAVVASDGSGHYKTRSRFGADVASVSWQPSTPDGSDRRNSLVQARRARRGNVPSGKGGGL